MKRGIKVMWVVIGILLLLIGIGFARIYIQNSQVPQLGIQGGQLAAVPESPNAVSTQTDDLGKKISPLPFKHDPESTMEAIIAAVKQYGGARIIKQDRDYLYVVFTTPLMRFHDDAEFYLDETNRLVHFRSSSRAGYSDMGLNRKRYDMLKEFYLTK